MGKNVMIPLFLLECIIELLVDIKPPVDHEFCFDYYEVLDALEVKIRKLELRGPYDQLIMLYSDEQRAAYRADWLRHNERSNNIIDEELPF